MPNANDKLAKHMRDFLRAFAERVGPLLTAQGFARSATSFQRPIDIGKLTVFVARSGRTVDVGLGLRDELAVTGTAVTNLGYERFPLPTDEPALRKAVAGLTAKVRAKWLPAIRRVARLRRPDTSRIDRALEHALVTTARLLRLPKPAVKSVKKARGSSNAYVVLVSVGTRSGKVTVPLSAPRSLLVKVFHEVGGVPRAKWEHTGRDVLVAMAPSGSALVLALATSAPEEAAKLHVLLRAPFFEAEPDHPLAKMFPKRSKLAKYLDRDVASVRALRELAGRAKKGTILERLEALRHIDQAFPYVFGARDFPAAVPLLEGLADVLEGETELALADEGAHLRRHLEAFGAARAK